MAKDVLVPASRNLLLMDREKIKTLVKQLPSWKRAAWSKAAKAACQHLRDAKKEYGQAYVIACEMIENWRLLGVEIPNLVQHGGDKRKQVTNWYVALDSLGITGNQSSRSQKLALLPPEVLGKRLKEAFDEDKYGLPSLWSASRSEGHPAGGAAEVLEGEFDVIVIDPPWPMQKIERNCRPNQDEFAYETMAEEALAAMGLPTAADCHVWCWATQRFLPMAQRLLQAWGLQYICVFVWHKPGGFQPVGLPQYNCEFALYARHGTPKFKTTKAFPVCFNAKRGEHSEKPEEFYDVVRRVTDGKRIDMFSRRKIKGFKGWGSEA